MPKSTPRLRTLTDLKSIDLICFSHLRWDFVYQRPHHLMSRFADHHRVFFVEEPVFEQGLEGLRVRRCQTTGVRVVTPILSAHSDAAAVNGVLRRLLALLVTEHSIKNYVAWFYTPMALEFTDELQPVAVIYDCMDELTLFKGAPTTLARNESMMFEQADLVFTGGVSLFEAKRCRHRNIHAFPSGVDVPHFASARSITDPPADQREIPHPQIGYAGVIDERIDLQLLADCARLRPLCHIVMIGPIAKISPETLPKAENIHYLGMKRYVDLPAYMSSWRAGILPFALNDATRFISPTKTPEYLAAGLPVISTAIRDVVRPYGELQLVQIASNVAEFANAVDQILAAEAPSPMWQARADAFLSTVSWNATWSAMNNLVLEVITGSRKPQSFAPSLDLADAVGAAPLFTGPLFNRTVLDRN